MSWLFVRQVFLREVLMSWIIVLIMFLGQHWNLLAHNVQAIQVMRRAVAVSDKADYACCDADCQNYLEGWHPRGVIDDYWKGRELFAAGKKLEAFQMWREAGVSEYFITVGEAYFRKGDINGAIKCLELATQIDPQRADIWYILGVVLQASGQQTAAEVLDRALELNVATISRKRYLEYYLQASDIYEMHGEWSKAIKLAERAAYLSPKWAIPLVKLALYYDRLDDTITSQQYLAEAKQIDPRDFWPWLVEGDIQRRHGQLDAARNSYLQAQALAPEADEPLARLVDLLVQTGQLDQAVSDLNSIIVKQPTRDLAYYYLSWTYSLQGRYTEAVEAYEIAIRLQPNNPRYRLNLDEIQGKFEIIIDNSTEGFTAEGSKWEIVEDESAFDGTYLRVNGVGLSEPHVAIWRPELPLEGEYKVYLRSVNNKGGWHVQFTVNSYDGISSGIITGRRASEQILNDRWVHLGTWYFKAGNSGYVSINSFRAGDCNVPWEGGADGLAYVNADAVRFVFSGKPIIVDNSDPGFTHSEGWQIGNHPAALANDYLVAMPSNGEHWAKWTPTFEQPGYYDVFARWVNNSGVDFDASMTQSAAYEINYQGGKSVKRVSQRWVRGVWVYLGTYPFEAGSTGYVRLVSTADGKVVADAIKFRRTETIPPPNRGYVKFAANGAAFVFQDGTPFVPLGYNLRDILFPEATTYYGVSDVEEIFKEMHTNHFNLLRFWMQDISERLWLFQDGNNFDQSLPPGSINMWYAQRMHDILYLAEKYDVFLVPVLWDDYYAAEYCWDVDPYNSQNGGPLVNRLYFNRFAESEAARTWQERLFRFLAEEYGGSTHIFAWDIGNDFGGDVEWVKATSSYLRSLDPNHFISYQYSTGIVWPKSVLDFVDFVSVRAYPYNVGNNAIEIAKTLRERIKLHMALGKPVIVGEFGPLKGYEPADKVSIANVTMYGLWTSITSGALSAWKWACGYGDGPDLTDLEKQFYSAAASILQDVHLSQGSWVDASAEIVVNDPEIMVSAIRSDRELLAWFMDDPVSAGLRTVTIQVKSNLSLSAYVWDWIDPRSGQILKSERCSSHGCQSTVDFEQALLLHIYMSPKVEHYLPYIHK